MADTVPKVVLITGTSSGIGKACAAHLLARGYRVFGTQRRVTAPSDGSRIEMLTMDVDNDGPVAQGIGTVQWVLSRVLPLG